MSQDSLMEMFDDLRQVLPTGVKAGEYKAWMESIAQVITFFPPGIRRMAAIMLVANDICKARGKSLDLCFKAVLWEVEQRKEVVG